MVNLHEIKFAYVAQVAASVLNVNGSSLLQLMFGQQRRDLHFTCSAECARA